MNPETVQPTMWHTLIAVIIGGAVASRYMKLPEKGKPIPPISEPGPEVGIAENVQPKK